MVERLHLPDALATIAHFCRQPWSDGLPVVPSTEALGRRMLDTVERRRPIFKPGVCGTHIIHVVATVAGIAGVASNTSTCDD